MDDNQIYNHARRILTAEMQNLVFGEFAQLLLGPDIAPKFEDGFTEYRAGDDPSILIEVSAAVFRFGHSTVNGFFEQRDPLNGSLIDGYLLRTSNNNVSIYSNNPDVGMTSIAKGMTLQPAQKFDRFMTQELTNFLYATQATGFSFGSDLAARNIQRGRDVGLRGWAAYRDFCTNQAPASWDQRPDDISDGNWQKLKSLYTNVQDIDLFTGCLAEEPVNGGILGRTPAGILSKQFQWLRDGDRYFFTHGGGVGMRLNLTQISAVKKVRMFDIVCLNTNISQLQKKAFKVQDSSTNPFILCTQAQSIDVKLFI